MFLTEITVDGNTTLINKLVEGTEVAITLHGDFGGGTVNLAYQDFINDTVNLYQDTAAVFTAAGETMLTMGQGASLIINMAGSTSPSVFVAAAVVNPKHF